MKKSSPGVLTKAVVHGAPASSAPGTQATLKASVVIRAYNEAKHLPEVFRRLANQTVREFEVILVDSGSTDETVAIAEANGARIVRIAKEEFTFGRSLNRGCAAARSQVLVFISGHCYPAKSTWLEEILKPFAESVIGLVYGMQRGGKTTKYSEHRHFAKTFPRSSRIPQEGFFCNNANCAVRRSVWAERHFDETLTGLEDLAWAKAYVAAGGKTGYAAAAGVLHLHNESWQQVFRRYEREAIALKRIMPDLTFSRWDLLRLWVHSTMLDWQHALGRGVFIRKARESLTFRLMQYWGTYQGFHEHRVLTQRIKETFYYPHKKT